MRADVMVLEGAMVDSAADHGGFKVLTYRAWSILIGRIQARGPSVSVSGARVLALMR